MRPLLILTLLFMQLGCQHPPKTSGEFEPDQDMKWEDLMSQRRLPALPTKSPELGQLAVWFRLHKARLFAGGVYGKQGPSTYYMATADKFRQPTRLYWAKVKVLSDKYACFMQQKWQRGELTIFRCKDGRAVAFWDMYGSGWNGFKGKQYDRSGAELYVDGGRIISR